jgi:cytolysin-activating lysine-acyltransferase
MTNKSAPESNGGLGQPHNDTSGKRPAGEKTVSEMLGEITWLMTQSSLHKQLFIGDLEWFAMPPIMYRQFRMFYGPQAPAACVFWATVSEETDARLEGGAHKLRADEWKNGNIPWLIELVAPFGAHEEVMADLSKFIFPTQSFKFHRVNDKGVREVALYHPEKGIINARN